MSSTGSEALGRAESYHHAWQLACEYHAPKKLRSHLRIMMRLYATTAVRDARRYKLQNAA